MAIDSPDKRKPLARKRRIEARLGSLSILFFLFMSSVLVVVLLLIIKNITETASRDYVRFYSVEAVNKLNAYLNRELGIVSKIARSNALTSWFANESDNDWRSVVYEEMMSYVGMLYSTELYFGINATLNEYSVKADSSFDQFKPFDMLSQAKEYDHWYFDCIASKHDYTLNIDIDKVTNQRRLWINHKVVHDGNILGVFCSGLQFGEVIKALFSSFTAANTRGFVVDSKGVIQMDSSFTADYKLDEYKTERRIQEMSDDASFAAVMNGYFAAENYFTAEDRVQVIGLTAEPFSYASVVPIPGTNWTVVTFYAESLFGVAKLLPLLYAMIGGLIVYTVVTRFLRRKLIFIPLHRLMDSLDKVGADTDAEIYGHDADDEFGDIARTVQSMREHLARNNEALLEAMELMGKANQAKTEFLARMSHEIRTPMNAIIGMAAIARQSEDPARLQHCLQSICDASAYLLGIINDILDMSKIEAGKFELSKTDFPLAAMLRQVKTVMVYKFAEKRQQFTVSVDTNVPAAIVADQQRLAQVIINLLSNAHKFTPQDGAINLDIRCLPGADDACVLQIAATDNGIGIAPEQQAKLFLPFEQVDGGMARKYEGTGLGLAISKKIVELMGGAISVTSELDKGARFVFTIRAGLGSATDEWEQSVPNPEKDAPIFTGKRILLAEDIDINREIFIALLEDTEVAIDCAENGLKACSMFADAPDAYDMIFMDIHMPIMDGYEATKRIRSMNFPKSRAIPIIAITANVFREDIEKCLAAGMNGHIGKPVEYNAVIAAMRQHMALSQSLP